MADTKISALSAVTDLLATDEYVLARSGATKKITGASLSAALGGGGLFNAYAYLRDEKASGTAGGSGTASAWNTRTLNTEVSDANSIVSLSANKFTVAAGSYVIRARGMNYLGGRSRLRIYDVTNSAVLLIGANSYASGGSNTIDDAPDCELFGTVVLGATTELRLDQWLEKNAGGGNVLGVANSTGDVEVYAEVEIWRLGSGGSSSSELFYAQVTSDVSIANGTSEASPVDIVSLGAQTYTAVPIRIEFYAPTITADTARAVLFLLFDGATMLCRLTDLRFGGTGQSLPAFGAIRLTPSAGSHTYRIRAMNSATGGSASVVSGGGGAGGAGTYAPISLRASRA